MFLKTSFIYVAFFADPLDNPNLHFRIHLLTLNRDCLALFLLNRLSVKSIQHIYTKNFSMKRDLLTLSGAQC